MTYTEIKAALDAAIQAIPDLPPHTAENEVSNTSSKSAFVRTTLLPSRPNRLTVGQTGKDELIGLYQVDIYYPKGTGTSSAMIDADAVIAAFPRDWVSEVNGHQLHVTQAWLQTSGLVNSWYSVSVSLAWSAIR